MLGLKLNHVSKRGHGLVIKQDIEIGILDAPGINDLWYVFNEFAVMIAPETAISNDFHDWFNHAINLNLAKPSSDFISIAFCLEGDEMRNYIINAY